MRVHTPDRSAWGGKRSPCCPDHPLADVKKRRILVCADCGQVIDDSTVTLKCQDDNSDFEQFAEFDEPAEDPGLPLNDQLDSLDTGALSPVDGAPPSRTTGGQADSSADRRPLLRMMRSVVQ